MAHSMHTSAPPITDLTYQSLHTLVQQLSERTKRHRKSSSSSTNAAAAAKAMEPVIRDCDHLLFSLKHHTMHSDSAASRVSEAQVWMYKAVMEKCAQNPEDEAMAYLTASSLWMSVEAERKALNIMTSSDALARAVLCCAMACNVLLSQKPNITTSPLPIKLTKMPNPYLSRCWSICMRLAHQLAEYGAYEMSADYFELAAILVTCDVPPATSGTAGGGGGGANEATKGVALSNNSSFVSAAAATPAATPSKSMTDVDCRSNSNAAGSTTSGRGAGGGGHLGSYAAGSRNSNGAAASPPQKGAESSPTHSIRSRATTATAGGGHLAGASFHGAHRVISGNVYGELSRAAAAADSSSSPQRQPQGQQQFPATISAPLQTPPSLILNGFLLQYLVALSSCAMTCALIQDYDRCLTVVDELLNRLSSIERSRRPELVPSWIVEAAQRRRAIMGDDAHDSVGDDEGSRHHDRHDDGEAGGDHDTHDGDHDARNKGVIAQQAVAASCVGEPLSAEPPVLGNDIAYAEESAPSPGDGSSLAEVIYSPNVNSAAARPSTPPVTSGEGEAAATTTAESPLAALDTSDEAVSATKHPLAFDPPRHQEAAVVVEPLSFAAATANTVMTAGVPPTAPSLAAAAKQFHRDPLAASATAATGAAPPALPRRESFSQRSGTESATASSSQAGTASRGATANPHRGGGDLSLDGSPTGRAAAAAAGRDANGGRTPVKPGSCPLAPPPGGSLHAHYVYTNAEHFSFLLETETVFLQMTVMKFLVLLNIRDPVVTAGSARAQIDSLLEVAYLYLQHEAYGASSSSAYSVATAGGGSAPRDVASSATKKSGSESRLPRVAPGAAKTHSPPDDSVSAQAKGSITPPPLLSSFPQRLLCLAEVLEIILDSFETFPADKRRMSSKEQELLLADALAEAVDISRSLGICTRNLLILFRRAETAVLRRR